MVVDARCVVSAILSIGKQTDRFLDYVTPLSSFWNSTMISKTSANANAFAFACVLSASFAHAAAVDNIVSALGLDGSALTAVVGQTGMGSGALSQADRSLLPEIPC